MQIIRQGAAFFVKRKDFVVDETIENCIGRTTNSPEYRKYCKNLCGDRCFPAPCSADGLHRHGQAFKTCWFGLLAQAITYYDDWADFVAKHADEQDQFYFFTTKGKHVHSDAIYTELDSVYIIFGREDKGLPEPLLHAHANQCVRIPMRHTLRSLNLSNSVAIATYEVLRQWGYPELQCASELDVCEED